MSEPVRIVYRQIRESLSVDLDIMEEVDGIVNDPVTVSGNLQSKLQELQNQAEELRVAFNRKHFMECNMSIGSGCQAIRKSQMLAGNRF